MIANPGIGEEANCILTIKSIFNTNPAEKTCKSQTIDKEMKLNSSRIFYKRLKKIAVETDIKLLTKAVK